MKRKTGNRWLAAALAAGMLAAGMGGNSALASEETDLSSLTFGSGWKIDTTKDYSGSQYKRFDGLEFTRAVNTSGFDLPEGMTIDDNDRVWMFELKTGLTPKTVWSANGDAYTQKLNACIASGEIPDLMYVDMNQYYSLIKSGLIADLTDELLEGNHPGIQALYEMGDNKALETLKVDGRIYGIPHVYMNFDGSPLVWIRQDWMEELGLEAPQTYADLEKIAQAFMESDLDGNGKEDTYGIPILPSFTADYGGSGNVCDLFLNVGGAAPGIWQKQEDGTVIYGSLMDGAKDALTLLNDWYQKGIIPSDFATWTAGRAPSAFPASAATSPCAKTDGGRQDNGQTYHRYRGLSHLGGAHHRLCHGRPLRLPVPPQPVPGDLAGRHPPLLDPCGRLALRPLLRPVLVHRHHQRHLRRGAGGPSHRPRPPALLIGPAGM